MFFKIVFYQAGETGEKEVNVFCVRSGDRSQSDDLRRWKRQLAAHRPRG